MSFDEENNDKQGKASKSLFGLELSNTVVYIIVIVLTVIFIRQAVILLQALN